MKYRKRSFGLSTLLFSLVAVAFLGTQDKPIKASSRIRPLPKCSFPTVYGGPSAPSIVASRTYLVRRQGGTGVLSYVKKSVQTSYNNAGSTCIIDRMLHKNNGITELAGPVLVDYGCNGVVDEIRVDKYSGCNKKGQSCPAPTPGFTYYRIKRSSGRHKGCFVRGDGDMRHHSWLLRSQKKP